MLKAITIIPIKNGFVSYTHEVETPPPLNQLTFTASIGTTSYRSDELTGLIREWKNNLDESPVEPNGPQAE